jgi:diadenosine tetraphosphate (Ap4A) HIT family hydrolase
MKQYNNNNVFAKILRKEIPCTTIYEDENVLCFEDISRAAPVHWLVIPKKNYIDFYDFTSQASSQEVFNFFKSINTIVQKYNLDEKGFRIVTNNGENSGQSVFHFHVHILSGKKMGELNIK